MSVRVSGPPRGVRCAGLNRLELGRRARRLLRAIGQGQSELSLVLVGDAAMAALNAAHRGRSNTTDVLAFSLVEGDHSGYRGPLLGDVVISLDTARRRARASRRDLDTELLVLLIHGVLHLVGYDHQRPVEARRMAREEKRLCDLLRSRGAPRPGSWPTCSSPDSPFPTPSARGDSFSTSAGSPRGGHPRAWPWPCAAWRRAGRSGWPGWPGGWPTPCSFTGSRLPSCATARPPPALGPLAVGAVALYPTLLIAAFGGLAARLAGSGPLPPLAGAALWTALEYPRSFFLTGFPWALLGYTQHENAALLGLAPATGVYGLSFAVAAGGFALAAWLRDGLRPALPGFAAVALAHAPGALDLVRPHPPPPAAQAREIRVAVLQGNIDQGVKWSSAHVRRTLTIYRELTLRAVADGAELVVWPETAVPGVPETNPALDDWLRRLARESGAVLCVGAVGATAEGIDVRYYDSAFLYPPDGAPPLRYDKSHLVPFGEYLPLRSIFGHAVNALARGSSPDDLTPGEAPEPLPLRLADGSALPVGTPICYELLFPDLVRRFVGAGGELLLAMTNDAWYGRTGAPYQFLAITALRAAETGVWTARAANTGVSALIDPRGRVRQQLPLQEEGLLVGDVAPRPAGARATWYVRHGDRFAQACWLGVAFAALPPAVRRRGLRMGRMR